MPIWNTPESKDKDVAMNLAKTGPSKLKAPENILLWISPDVDQRASRVIRMLGLAEALQKAGSDNLHIASPPAIQIAEECSKRGMLWRDNQRAQSESLQNALSEIRPNLTFAEVSDRDQILPIHPPDSLLGCFSDAFIEELLELDFVLLPGFIDPPPFENLRVPPSFLAKCVHGPHVYPLPELYSQPLASEASNLLLAIDEQSSLDAVHSWIDQIRNWDLRPLSLLMDISSEVEDQFAARYPDLIRVGRFNSLQTRLDVINQSRVIITFPGLHIYEYLARGKALVVLYQNEKEKQYAESLLGMENAPILSAQVDHAREECRIRVNELLFNHELRKQRELHSYERISRRGNQRLIRILLERMR